MCQFARVVKGVDLRSTARKCAWVGTPQLTFLYAASQAMESALPAEAEPQRLSATRVAIAIEIRDSELPGLLKILIGLWHSRSEAVNVSN